MPEPTPAPVPAIDPRVDAALAGRPAAPLPEGFVARAMAQVRAEAADAHAGAAPRPAVDLRIDAVLAGRPAAPLPVGFAARVMAGVRTDAAVPGASAPAPPASARRGVPRIRPPARRRTWPVLDVVLPGLLVVLLGVVAGVAVWSMNAVDPLWGARLALEARLTWATARYAAPDLGAGFVVAVGAAFTLVACLAGLALSVEPMLAGGVGRVRGRGMG